MILQYSLNENSCQEWKGFDVVKSKPNVAFIRRACYICNLIDYIGIQYLFSEKNHRHLGNGTAKQLLQKIGK